MKQPDIEKFKRFIVICLVAIFLFSIGLVCLISYKIGSDVNRSIAGVIDIAKVPGPKGADGQSILTTIVSYTEGKPGKDGKNATDEQVAQAVATYLNNHPVYNGIDGQNGSNGVNGVDGKDGANGKTVFTRQNQITGENECRYAGDTVWQPETECH